jgi:hypothetical protein
MTLLIHTDTIFKFIIQILNIFLRFFSTKTDVGYKLSIETFTMVNNKKINNYYRKKNSPQRNKSQDNDATDPEFAATNHHVHTSNKNQVNTVKMVISENPKQSSLATAATSQVGGSTTGQGIVRKILGSVVIGEGTTTILTDMGVSVPVITQTAHPGDTSMESGLLSEEESGQTKLMSYEADKSADELDTLEGENDFMNLSAMSNTMNVQEIVTTNDHDLSICNDMNTTLGEQLINVSIIQQEPEVHTNIPLVMRTTTNVAPATSPIVNTISPDKANEFKPQVIPTSTKQLSSIEEISNDDGFTIVQHTRKTHQKSALDQLKKQHNISKHGLPTPSVNFRNSHIAYYDLRVPLLETKDDTSPWDEVLRAFKAMMTELWGADPTIKIFIYDTKKRSNDTSFLDSPRAFNDLNLENFTSYFFNGYPLFGGGMRNAQILMSHAKPFEEIRRNINHYLLRFNAGFFKKSLQCEVSSVLGWAYMTMEKMDRSLLAEKLSERMGIPVGIQWRMISTGVPTKATKNEDKVRAIHFEVETKYSGYAKKALADIYDYKKMNNYPLGIRMRFVPDIARVTESKDKVKLSTLIGLQRAFQEKIGTYTNGEVRNVDATLPDGQTIREYLMALKVGDEENKNMFVAINPDPLRGGTQFAFFPQFRDDATTTLLHLLVCLRSEFQHVSKDKVDLLFNSTAIERADETLWNSETKKAFTMESECIAGILEAAQTCDLMYTQLG